MTTSVLMWNIRETSRSVMCLTYATSRNILTFGYRRDDLEKFMLCCLYPEKLFWLNKQWGWALPNQQENSSVSAIDDCRRCIIGVVFFPQETSLSLSLSFWCGLQNRHTWKVRHDIYTGADGDISLLLMTKLLLCLLFFFSAVNLSLFSFKKQLCLQSCWCSRTSRRRCFTVSAWTVALLQLIAQ